MWNQQVILWDFSPKDNFNHLWMSANFDIIGRVAYATVDSKYYKGIANLARNKKCRPIGLFIVWEESIPEKYNEALLGWARDLCLTVFESITK